MMPDCVVSRDELSSDPAKMMRKVEEFLGIPAAKYPQKLLEHRRYALAFAAAT